MRSPRTSGRCGLLCVVGRSLKLPTFVTSFEELAFKFNFFKAVEAFGYFTFCVSVKLFIVSRHLSGLGNCNATVFAPDNGCTCVVFIYLTTVFDFTAFFREAAAKVMDPPECVFCSIGSSPLRLIAVHL